MNFISVQFFVFIFMFVAVYYITPVTCRYIPLFIGSYLFYGFGDVSILMFLIVTTLITYIGGVVLEKYKKKSLYIIFFMINLSVLVVFKYANFVIENFNNLLNAMDSKFIFATKNLALPIGLSFYIFQSCTYLGDVYHGKILSEKNLMRYAAFVSFFPTVLMGPIQKARKLIPQIKAPADFDFDRALHGTMLLIWGFFEKLLVAENLQIIVNKIYGDQIAYGKSVYCILAAICFSLYIYADFSSYSDMACGIAKILGINIERNFNNPYLSKNLTEFWRRWHVSLNEWFVEYIYIPLGGNRKGAFRKYINTFIVFFVSGLWHGAEWHFVIWGIINGLLVIIGQLLKVKKEEFYKKIRIEENSISIQIIKQIICFSIVTITWVFFQNGVRQSVDIIKKMLFFCPSELFVPELLSICGTTVHTFLTVIMVVVFCIIQINRKVEGKCYLIFSKQPPVIQCIILAFLIYVCIFGAFIGNAELNTKFMYFQF